MSLSPSKDEWQIPYPSGTENWQIPHSIPGGSSEIHLILPLYKLNKDKNVYIYIAQKLIFFKQENIDSEFAHFWPKMR